MPVRGDVRTFIDYTRYYNNCEALYPVQAIQKIGRIENENELYILKII